MIYDHFKSRVDRASKNTRWTAHVFSTKASGSLTTLWDDSLRLELENLTSDLTPDFKGLGSRFYGVNDTQVRRVVSSSPKDFLFADARLSRKSCQWTGQRLEREVLSGCVGFQH